MYDADPDGGRAASATQHGRYRDKLYSRYATTHAGQRSPAASLLAFKRDVAPHLPNDKRARIIDVGCGQGDLTLALKGAGYRSVTAVDVSEEQAAIASARGVDVTLGDYHEVLRAAQFDVVIATDFFEHLDKPEVMDAFGTISIALAGGGTLIARVPNSAGPFGGNYQYGDFTHETAFTPRSLKQLARNHNFDEPEVFPCNPVGTGLGGLIRRMIWAPASALMKLAFTAETGERHPIITQNVVLVARRPKRDASP